MRHGTLGGGVGGTPAVMIPIGITEGTNPTAVPVSGTTNDEYNIKITTTSGQPTSYAVTSSPTFAGLPNPCTGSTSGTSSANFLSPAAGTYNITASATSDGNTYEGKATLTVSSP